MTNGHFKLFTEKVIKTDKTIKKKNEKYENILCAAFSLFEENGISAVPIDDIVKKAGVAKGTFYLYFKDKMDLISKIILKKVTDYLQKNELLIDEIKDSSFENHIKTYIDMIVDFLHTNKTLTQLIDKNTHICVNAVIENRDGAIKVVYDKIVDSFIEKGYEGKSVQIRMYLYLDMIVSAVCNALLRKSPYNMDDIKPHIYNIVLDSIKIAN